MDPSTAQESQWAVGFCGVPHVFPQVLLLRGGHLPGFDMGLVCLLLSEVLGVAKPEKSSLMFRNHSTAMGFPWKMFICMCFPCRSVFERRCTCLWVLT